MHKILINGEWVGALSSAGREMERKPWFFPYGDRRP